MKDEEILKIAGAHMTGYLAFATENDFLRFVREVVATIAVEQARKVFDDQEPPQ